MKEFRMKFLRSHDSSPSSGKLSEPDNPPTKVLFIALLALSVALVVLSFALNAWLSVTSNEDIYRKDLALGNPVIEGMKAQWEEELANYAELDKAKGTYQIPIEAAMQAVIQDKSIQQSGGAN